MQKTFVKANLLHFSGALPPTKLTIMDKKEEVAREDGEPLYTQAFFDIDTKEICLGSWVDIRIAKSFFLHEMVHYYLWVKYSFGKKAKEMSREEWLRINHSPEFMLKLMKVFRNEFMIEDARKFYNKEKYIDSEDGKKIKYFHELIPFVA